MSNYIVIPARFSSTRFPGKLLALLSGKPVIRWVVENALEVKECKIVLATDSEKIAEVISDLKDVRVIMTPSDIPSGTDRVAFAVKDLPSPEFVINLQGDEPLLSSELIEILLENHLESDLDIFTLARKLREDEDPSDQNLVKVVFDRYGKALYFSRSPVPFYKKTSGDYFIHIGIYSYRYNSLEKFISLSQSPLERAEKLEQLRALENEMSIGVKVVDYNGVGIDTEDDLRRAELLLKYGEKSNSI